MFSRRNFGKQALASGLAALASGAVLRRVSAATGSDSLETVDGLHAQPWFMNSFLELPDDLEETRIAGKRFAVIWEQEGCPYCRELHRVNFSRADVRDYIRNHFGVLQLDLLGSRKVTDFDGEVIEEKMLARKWRVHFTPTIQFFPDSLEVVSEKPGGDVEVARMPGYFKPFHFITMFEYVYERAYERVGFQDFLREKIRRLISEGKIPEVW